MFDHFVYQHKTPNSDIPFYIGKGKGYNYARAYSSRHRNNHWNNIVKKHGIEVTITHDKICVEEANKIESYLIEFYGRMDLGSGVLCNMTDGGDGSINYKHTEQTKEKFKKRDYSRFKGESNPMFGKKMTEEHKKKVSDAAIISNKKRGCSEKTKKKISESLKKFNLENEGFAKKNMTNVVKEKISKKLKGRVFTEEWKRKISESKKGK